MSLRRAYARQSGLVQVAASATYEVELAEPSAGRSLGAGEFLGYATVFGSPFLLLHERLWEDVETVISPGAFAKTLAARTSRNPVPVFLEHAVPIGPTVEVREDARGLFCHGRVSDTTDGRDTLVLMKDGVFTEMSIGFFIEQDSLEQREDGSYLRTILAVDLIEVTVTIRGRVPGTSIDQVAASAASGLIDRHPLEAVQAFALAHAGRDLTQEQRDRVAASVASLNSLLVSEPIHDEAATKARRVELLRAELELFEGQLAR